MYNTILMGVVVFVIQASFREGIEVCQKTPELSNTSVIDCICGFNDTVCLICPASKESDALQWNKDKETRPIFRDKYRTNEQYRSLSVNECDEDLYSLKIPHVDVSKTSGKYICQQQGITRTTFLVTIQVVPTMSLIHNNVEGSHEIMTREGNRESLQCRIAIGVIPPIIQLWKINGIDRKIERFNGSANGLRDFVSTFTFTSSSSHEEISCSCTGQHIIEGNVTAEITIETTTQKVASFLYYPKTEYGRDCKGVFNQCIATEASGVYLIRPEGYPDPFEVYCNNNVESGGWTVIQRRLDESLTFKRLWEDYKLGFGFLETEFWLGNKKLSYLTNQAAYELRIDVLLANGTELYVSYDHFRISDEWNNFTLAHVGTSNAVGDFTQCPVSMVYGNCTCLLTCEDPTGLNGCHGNCVGHENCTCADGLFLKGDKCVALNECPCFVLDEGNVIPEGGFLANSDCSAKSTCLSQTLIENSAYNCDPNADCKVVSQIQRCYCREGFYGNGESCIATFADCLEAYNAGHRENGTYAIFPLGWSGLPFKAFCNMETDGGGWMKMKTQITEYLTLGTIQEMPVKDFTEQLVNCSVRMIGTMTAGSVIIVQRNTKEPGGTVTGGHTVMSLAVVMLGEMVALVATFALARTQMEITMVVKVSMSFGMILICVT